MFTATITGGSTLATNFLEQPGKRRLSLVGSRCGACQAIRYQHINDPGLNSLQKGLPLKQGTRPYLARSIMNFNQKGGRTRSCHSEIGRASQSARAPTQAAVRSISITCQDMQQTFLPPHLVKIHRVVDGSTSG